MSNTIAIVGECLLELRQQKEQPAGHSKAMDLSYGGDTLNAAIYLARQGITVDYVTALGDDPMSEWMVAQWRSEGVGCELVQYVANAVPGMYWIETDERGERTFYYWRDSAPARRLFDDELSASQLFDQLSKYAWLALSGITLAIYSDVARQRFFSFLEQYRSDGGKVIFDGNYRPKLWSNNETTRAAYERMYQLTDIALPTIEDEQQVFGAADEHQIMERLKSWGVTEVALKMGEQGCLVVADGASERVPAHKVTVVDTTSAGDSFNAGYLAARMQGALAPAAAQSGHDLASVVVQHAGAIIPAIEMPH